MGFANFVCTLLPTNCILPAVFLMYNIWCILFCEWLLQNYNRAIYADFENRYKITDKDVTQKPEVINI